MSNKPNNSGDGELFAWLAVGGGAGCGAYLLFSRLSPDAWPHAIIGGLAHAVGQSTTPHTRAIIAGVMVGILAMVATIYVVDHFKQGIKLRAQTKTAREALAFEEAKDKLAAKGKAQSQTRPMVDTIARAQARAERGDRATPGFIAACAVGFGLAILVVAHFLL